MNHTWKIYDLKRTISDGVVNRITYACESEYSGSGSRRIGELEITGDASNEGFIPYEDLNEGDVLAWVTGSEDIDTSAIEALCSASIAEQIVSSATITEATGTPWVN